MKIKSLILIPMLGAALAFTPQKTVIPALGIVSDISQDSLVHASGFTMMGESVRRILSPPLTDEAFEEKLKVIKAAKTKVISCNNFFPAELKIAGPNADEAKVLAYTETVLSRAQRVGIKYVVLGSGGARNIPEGYDPGKARADFVKLGSKLAQIAARYKVTIVLENLERTETNFITSLKEAADIVRKINHPSLRLNVDIFHMMRQQEPPSDILASADIVGLSEIAETESRTLPGVKKDDFKPYLRALKEIKYKGYIFIEGSTKNPALEVPQAFKYLTSQLHEVYAEKGG